MTEMQKLLSLEYERGFNHAKDIYKCQEGKWLHFASSDDCPFCGYSTGKYERGRNYCPDCGARLE